MSNYSDLVMQARVNIAAHGVLSGVAWALAFEVIRDLRLSWDLRIELAGCLLVLSGFLFAGTSFLSLSLVHDLTSKDIRPERKERLSRRAGYATFWSSFIGFFSLAMGVLAYLMYVAKSYLMFISILIACIVIVFLGIRGGKKP